MSESEPASLKAAKAIYRLRFLFVVVWPVLAVIFAPFGFLLLFRVSGGLKRAPPGTESYDALQVFKEHYADLAEIRLEKLVFSCRTPCESAVNTMSRGLVEEVTSLIKRFNYTHPGSILQVQSYYTFEAHHASVVMGGNMMISHDQQSILLQWAWLPTRLEDRDAAKNFIFEMQAMVEEIDDLEGPNGMEVKLTGLTTLDVVLKKTLIEEIIVHEIKTIWLPFLILAYALQSPRMLLLALIPMGIELPIGLGIMYFVSLKTNVLLYSVEMMMMLMTALSFDYALFLLTRYAEERRMGAVVEDAIITVISQTGRVVVTSGCVLIISWGCMLGLPGMFVIFSFASGTMILICVLVQLTFVPSLLAILPFLGPPQAQPSVLRVGELARSRGRCRTRTPPLLKGDGNSPNSPNSTTLLGAWADVEEKAAPFKRGIGFCIGGILTGFPFNVILPIMVYAMMSPLAMRFSRNFDVWNFRYQAGHLFETSVPRGAREWATALEIQQSFPNSMGVMMPMMIIATNALGVDPNATLGEELVGTAAADGVGTAAADGASAPAARPIDVRGQEFFDANCRMLNALVQACRGTSYELEEQNLVSLTIHGTDPDTGRLQCMDYWKVRMVQENWFAKHVFLQHTSDLAQTSWNSMVSKRNHAMISFVFPAMDPFGQRAFELANTVRQVLHNETLASRSLAATLPGLTFMVFSPGTVVMDLIEITQHALPVAFLSCVAVCFTLVACMFGAMFIPIKLVMTVLIPLTWTYGAALFVYEDGKLAWLGIDCLMPVGDSGLDWTVPVFTLTFLVGCALDYDVFLFERVREFRAEGFGDRESIQLGLSATGGTISCAGLIMAFSFGGSTLLGSLPTTNQIGFVLVFAILVDTFLVRTILTPAMLSLNPVINFWPSKMPTPRYVWLGGAGIASTRSLVDEEDRSESD